MQRLQLLYRESPAPYFRWSASNSAVRIYKANPSPWCVRCKLQVIIHIVTVDDILFFIQYHMILLEGVGIELYCCCCCTFTIDISIVACAIDRAIRALHIQRSVLLGTKLFARQINAPSPTSCSSTAAAVVGRVFGTFTTVLLIIMEP